MKRREFVAASCLAGLAPLGSMALGKDADAPAKKEYYELRLYRLKSAEKQKAMCEFFAKAAIPAMNRLGVNPVGVFKMAEGDDPNLWVLLPHKSLESVATLNDRLLADAAYRKAGAAVLDVPKSDPAYERIESSLMLAFDDLPKLEVPVKGKSRVFQLRIYEGHNAERAKKKVEMFNAGGEIALFRETGLHPVFFGESLVGSKLPNLTYMIGFESMEQSKANWKKFLTSPGWKKLKGDPAYKDTVSGITNLFLHPAGCSQI